MRRHLYLSLVAFCSALMTTAAVYAVCTVWSVDHSGGITCTMGANPARNIVVKGKETHGAGQRKGYVDSTEHHVADIPDDCTVHNFQWSAIVYTGGNHDVETKLFDTSGTQKAQASATISCP